jgi:hypothetical protein
MTDFFAQLAARHRGEAAALRPRVPFRFEPVGPSPAGPIPQPAATSGWPPPRPGHPWRGPQAADDDQPPVGLHPVGPAGLLPELTADTGRNRMDAERSGVPASGHPGQPARGPRREAPDAAAAGPQTPAPQAGPGTAPFGPVSRAAALRPAPAAPAAIPGAAAPEPAATPEPVPLAASLAGSLTGPRPAARDAGPGQAALAARRGRRPGPGHRDEPDAGEDRDAGRARASSPPVLRPQSAAHPGWPLTAAASAQGRRRLADQPRAQAHGAGPGQENITVQVTIGRVEVRAAPPATRAPAAPRRAAGPSLADYLRHRSRGAAV